MIKTEYTKLRTKLIGILDGLSLIEPKYFNVIQAIYYGESIHTNLRKDGQPEFSHQLEMLSMAISLHSLLTQPYEVYLSILFHDAIEDYPHTHQGIVDKFPCVAGYSNKLSKTGKDTQAYFDEIAKCSVSSIVKLVDRVHNLSTASGVFSENKLKDYCQEVDDYFVPMIRIAKTQFNQRQAYELLKRMLYIEVHTITKLLEK